MGRDRSPSGPCLSLAKFGLFIREKHGKDFIKKLPKTLSKGEIYKHDSEPDHKRYVVLGNDVAILQRKSGGGSKSWAITHFDEYRGPQLATIKEKSRRVASQYIQNPSTQ